MDDDKVRGEQLAKAESEIKDARRREKALQNDLAIVRSQLAVKEEKLKAAVREIVAAKAASRESSAVHVAQLSTLRQAVSRLSERLVEREREFEADMAAVRQSLSEATRNMRGAAFLVVGGVVDAQDDALVAATFAFDAKQREAQVASSELEAARDAQAAGAKALDRARDEKNQLIAKSNSLQRTLESLKHDLGRVTRESEKQRCATQQLRLTLTEAIDDRDKALAAKEEWREVAGFPGTVDKLDKASAKENE